MADRLERVAEFKPQLLLLDVMIPGMVGPTTLNRLCEMGTTARLPAVFMSTKAPPGEIAQYKELDVVDVIPKPFDPVELANKVRAIWEKSHG